MSDSSSSTGTDSDTKHEGPYGARCKKNIKKCREKPGKRARVCTTMSRSVEGHFTTFKPVEVIQRGIEKFTGIKGLPDSWIRELDNEVQISENKKYEHVLFTVQKGVLAALTAMIPVANRMMEQNKFTSLAADTCLNQWQQLTNCSWLLDAVKGVEIEFVSIPIQHRVPFPYKLEVLRKKLLNKSYIFYWISK